MITPEQIAIDLFSKIFVRNDKLGDLVRNILIEKDNIRDIVSPEAVLDAMRRWTEPEAFEAYTILNFENLPKGGRTDIQIELQELISTCRLLLNTIPVTKEHEIGMITSAGHQEFEIAIAEASTALVVGVKDVIVEQASLELNNARLKFLRKIFKEINTSMFTEEQVNLNRLYNESLAYISTVKVGTNVGEVLETDWLRFYFAIDYALTGLFNSATSEEIQEAINRLNFEKELFDLFIISDDNVLISGGNIYSLNKMDFDVITENLRAVYNKYNYMAEFETVDYVWIPTYIIDNNVIISLDKPDNNIFKSNKDLKWVCGLYNPTSQYIYTRTILPGNLVQTKYQIIDGAIFNNKWYSEYGDAIDDIKSYLQNDEIVHIPTQYIWKEEDSVFMRSGWVAIVDDYEANLLPKSSTEFKLRFNCIAVIASSDTNYTIDSNASINTDFTAPYDIRANERIISNVMPIDNTYKFLSRIVPDDPNSKVVLLQLKDGYESKVVSGFISSDMVVRIIAPNGANYTNWTIRVND